MMSYSQYVVKQGFNGSAFTLMVILSAYADQRGQVLLSKKKLAELAHLSSKTVHKTLKGLTNKGVLRLEKDKPNTLILYPRVSSPKLVSTGRRAKFIKQITQLPVKGIDYRVLLALAVMADANGMAFPLKKTLASYVGIKDVKTIQKSLRSLERQGFLKRTARKNSKAQHYTLLLGGENTPLSQTDTPPTNLPKNPPREGKYTPLHYKYQFKYQFKEPVLRTCPSDDCPSGKEATLPLRKGGKEDGLLEEILSLKKKIAYLEQLVEKVGPQFDYNLEGDIIMKVDEVLSSVKKKQKQYRPKTPIARLEHVWKVEMADAFPDRRIKPFSGKERGQLKHLLSLFSIDQLEEAITEVIQHWADFVIELRDYWGIPQSPNEPVLGFLVVHIESAINFTEKRKKKAKKSPSKKTGKLKNKELVKQGKPAMLVSNSEKPSKQKDLYDFYKKKPVSLDEDWIDKELVKQLLGDKKEKSKKDYSWLNDLD